MGLKTTDTGYVNKHHQRVTGATGLSGTGNNQQTYRLECQKCSEPYGANGCDIYERKCPPCGGGRPGNPI